MELRWQRSPAEVLYGWGSAEYLKGVRRARTALIADRALLPFGPLGQITDWLSANRAPLTRIKFQAKPGEPSTSAADRAAEHLRSFEPDLVVAVGGGSTIELAKAAWALYEYPALNAASLLRTAALPGLRSRARFIALPTTHGSGAESTPTLGLFHQNRFCEFRCPSLVPDRAILDPNLLAGLPAEAAAASGFDALAHAAEAIFSAIPGPMADVHALAAIPRLLADLPRLAAEPGNRAARESALYASSLAGNAAGNRHPGLAHALANSLGNQLSIAHGAILAWVLPEVIRFNAEEFPDPARSIARAAECGDIEDFAVRLVSLRRDLGLSETPPDYGTGDDGPRFELDQAVQDTLASPHVRSNPRSVTPEDVRRILEGLWPGRSARS